jgi:hypothetical protein
MRRPPTFIGLFPLVLGLFPLINGFSNPRAQALHGADRLQLMAPGFCFGVAFVWLLQGFRHRRE